MRLMALGGSVTYGVGSSTGNGYREYLRDMLLAEDIPTLLVGSRKAGAMENSENEGWRGYRLDQIAQKARRSVQKLRPDIITINAGSNDCVQNFRLETFAERMESMLESIWQSSHLTIIVSTLLPNADKDFDQRVAYVNSQIRSLVTSKITAGKQLVLADMYSSGGPGLSDLVDGTHPDDDGYKKMAVIWRDAALEARKRGLLA